MKISFDKEVDALYIRLLEGEYQCRVLHIGENVTLNIGPNGELVGIEILDAQKNKILEKDVPELLSKAAAGDYKWAMAA
ncbi:MAG: DUF2283 domain-containing protein [Chitinophagales bacterium]|nr:DUF2283 domain-containing protein [Chitinophagales bacterium]